MPLVLQFGGSFCHCILSSLVSHGFALQGSLVSDSGLDFHFLQVLLSIAHRGTNVWILCALYISCTDTS